MSLLVIVSGPSCAGKTPLIHSVKQLYPSLNIKAPVLYTSRAPRPGEKDGKDFYFRDEQEIRSLDKERFVVAPVRHLWQALELEELQHTLQSHTAILDIYPTFADELLKTDLDSRIPDLSVHRVFIAPLTEQELTDIQHHMNFASPRAAMTSIMMHKQIRRAIFQAKVLTKAELEDIQMRASKAYKELKMSESYDTILVNHDTEDSDHWHFTPPLGDAGKTVHRLAELIGEWQKCFT
jgi:guanylate kinase